MDPYSFLNLLKILNILNIFKNNNKMKTIQTIIEVEGEGLLALLNKNVLIMCFNYFYAGN